MRLTKTPSQEADVFRNTDSSVSHHILDLHFEDNKKTLGTVLSNLPGANLKRKFSSDAGDLQSLDVPSKIPRKGQFLNVLLTPSGFLLSARKCALFCLERYDQFSNFCSKHKCNGSQTF